MILVRKDLNMPYIEVNITKGATNEQKAQLVEGITDLMVKIMNKNPYSTHVISGKSVKRLRADGDTANISKV